MKKQPWLTHYDKGVPHTMDFPEIPVFAFLEQAAQKYPKKACTVFSGAEISYQAMDELSDRLAAGFASLGIKKGDRVGLFIPNTPQFVMAYFGLQKLGAIVVATNPQHTPREIEEQVNDAGVAAMVLLSNHYEKIKELQPRTAIRQLVVTGLAPAAPVDLALRDGDVRMQDLIAPFKASDRPKVNISAEDTALLQYTGGTTGVSKGVVAAHRGLVANACQIDAWHAEGKDGQEVVLLAIPLYHAYGMVIGMLYGMRKGASLVMVADPRDIKSILEAIEKYKVTVFPGVPAIYNAVNNHPDVIAGKYDLSSIRFCISGSAPLMSETKRKFEELTHGHLVEGYGLSEAPVATHCNPVAGENKIGSIGLPLPGVDCRIVDVEDGVTEVPAGEAGELLVNGPTVMKGYHNLPTETKLALRDGWLYTGDIATMDEDGFFFIVDRKKELIKPSSGFQVWPREVEEILQQNPKVREVGVAGVPDAASGEAVKAWVVLKDGEVASAEEMRAWCDGKLAGYKVPKQIEFIKELPRTTVGKILRRELVRMHNEVSMK
jgi:long-chain acyl-CoA synthetase